MKRHGESGDVERKDWRRARDNHGELASWMLHLVDSSPDRLGIIEIPHWAVSDEAATREAEGIVSREFDRAKRERPTSRSP